MEFHTFDRLDTIFWPEARQIYRQAFAEEGRKSDTVIESMFQRGLCFLHVLTNGSKTVSMAISAITGGGSMLLIDYLAVRQEVQGKGIGSIMLRSMKEWAASQDHMQAILVEVEAGPGDENRRRTRFWQHNGFSLTDYIHHYIWVPEPYQAMLLPLHGSQPANLDGKELFQAITSFHRKAYRKSSQQDNDATLT